MSKNQTLSTVIIIGFLCSMLIIGIILQKRTKTSRGFLTGNGKLGTLLAAGMFAATFLSGSSAIGYTGFLYTVGWSGFTAILGTALSLVIVGCFLVRKIRKHAGEGMETLADLLADRYENSKLVRGLAALSMVVLYTIFTAAETIGIGKTLCSFLGWNYYLAVIIAIAFIIAYVVLGGMTAVAVNDTICGILGIGGILLLAILCLVDVGGLGSLNVKMAAIDTNLVVTFADKAAIIACIGNAAVWGIGNSSHPVFLAQTFSTKSTRTVLKSMALSSVCIFIFYFSIMILGGTAHVKFPNLPDQDYAFAVLTQNLMSPLGASILLAAVIALIISTIDSCLLTAGAAMGNDFIVKTLGLYVDDDKKRLKIIRISIICVAFLGMLLALLFHDSTIMIFQMFNFGASGAVFWVPIVFGLYWKRATTKGAISSMIGGIIVYMIWFFTGYISTGLHPVLPGFIAAIILMIVVSKSTKSCSDEVLVKYFPKSSL